jgi:hypothetical protein
LLSGVIAVSLSRLLVVMSLISSSTSPHTPRGHIPAHPFGELGMTEMEMTNDIETEEFTDELSDEALDRGQGEGSKYTNTCKCVS